MSPGLCFLHNPSQDSKEYLLSIHQVLLWGGQRKYIICTFYIYVCIYTMYIFSFTPGHSLSKLHTIFPVS